MGNSRRLTVVALLATVLTLVLVGCTEKILAPRELRTRVKIKIAAAQGVVDHGWLTIDNDTESRHRMALMDGNLQSDVIELMPGPHSFEAIAVDAEDTVLYRGATTDTIPSDVDDFTVEIVLHAVQPDLVVSSLTHSPATPTMSDQVTFTAVVRNSGSSFSGPSKLEIRVGNETTAPTYDVPALAPNATFQMQRQQALAVARNYLIAATADVLSQVQESNEHNNVTTDTVTVTSAPRPDLVVSSLTHSPPTPTTSDQVTFTAVVRNSGSSTSGPSKLEFRVGNETTAPTYDVPALAPNATFQMQRQQTLAVAQNYLITATADLLSQVQEANEQNNVTTETVTVTNAPQPDLVISSLTHSPASPTTGELVSFTAVVRNSGSSSSGISYVRFTGEPLNVDVLVPALAPNETSEVGTAEVLYAAKNYLIHATADATHLVTESNEQNNVITDTVTATADCPGYVGYSTPPGEAWCVVVDESLAYVADGTAGLRIIDTSNASEPFIVGTYDTPGFARGVAVDGAGGRAYVADETQGLQVIDVSNPSAPTLLGSVPTDDRAFAVAWRGGDHVYVADVAGGLQIINVAIPGFFFREGFFDTPGEAWGVAVQAYAGTTENYTLAYVADGWTGGLQIIDVTNPSNPYRAGWADTPGDASGVILSGGAGGMYAFIADGPAGLQVVDVDNRWEPNLIPGAATPTGPASYALCRGTGLVSLWSIFVADRVSGIHRVNVVNPVAPQITDSFETVDEANWVVYDGALTYIADKAGGLRIINTSCFSK